jgi:Tol biopolymer transport system component
VPDADTSEVTDIYIIPSSCGEPRRLTDSQFTIASISYSPDGGRIAFIGNDRPEELAVDESLWVMPSGGGAPRRADPAFDRSLGYGVGSDLRVASPDTAPVWSLTERASTSHSRYAEEQPLQNASTEWSDRS